MSESMADFEKEIDESLKTLNVVENEGEAPEEETGFNAWDKVQQYLEDGTVLSLKIGGIVNKGVIVYVDGLRGFIPASHLEIGYVEDTNPYLGKTVEAKVITADPEKNRLVLSVKEVLYDKKRAEKEQRINAIEAGAVLTGKVESLMPYGAFIDLGDDISGLVHISQIAQIRTIYHLHKISTRKFHYRRWFPTADLHNQKKENIPYPRCGFGAGLRCGRAS